MSDDREYKLTPQECRDQQIAAFKQRQLDEYATSFTEAPDPIEYREAIKHLLKKRRKKHGRR
ncbi:MAG: hypothetical protein CVU94_00660 [Firmicutes bacterium HGW-Firmicutes-19]|jgi:hypothetical protein|nr:MAG: hypothetical protein CVU94_00660 [Firmicutes bacterium HGW-Firmicutes-19]